MQAIFEAAIILFLLFLVLRISLRRRGEELRLRGGLVTLNVLTGALAGWAGAMAARAAALPAADPASGAASGAGTGGLIDVSAAAMRLLPFAGFVLGGLAGHALFGALWRRLLRHGPAAARAWLRRAQFVVVGAALFALVRHLLR